MLFGEHVVLQGSPALTTTLNMEFIAQWSMMDEDFEFYLGEPYRDSVLKILECLWDKAKLEKPMHGLVSMASTIPIGQGFGSSAALCVSFAYLVHNVKTDSLSDCGMMLPTVRPANLSLEERMIVWKLANEAEQLIHGRASGIDTGAVLHPGLTCFRSNGVFPPEASPVERLDAWLVFGNVQREQAAKACISLVASQSNTMAYKNLTRIANDAANAVSCKSTRRKVHELALLANDSMRSFSQLGILPESMERLHALALNNGALGGKMCGAGAGGAFWFITKTKERALKLRNSLLGVPGCRFADMQAI